MSRADVNGSPFPIRRLPNRPLTIKQTNPAGTQAMTAFSGPPGHGAMTGQHIITGPPSGHPTAASSALTSGPIPSSLSVTAPVFQPSDQSATATAAAYAMPYMPYMPSQSIWQPPPTPASTNVANKVFERTDLLEIILMRLGEMSPAALLKAQQVAPFWKRVVQESNTAQQFLFFQARPISDFVIFDEDALNAGFRPQHYSAFHDINLHVCDQSAFMPEMEATDRFAEDYEGALTIHPHLLNDWAGSAAGVKSAWQMFLTQPPTRKVVLFLADAANQHLPRKFAHRVQSRKFKFQPPNTLTRVVENAHGVRLGDVLRAYGVLLNAYTLPWGPVPAHLTYGQQWAENQPRYELGVLYQRPELGFDPAPMLDAMLWGWEAEKEAELMEGLEMEGGLRDGGF